MYRLRTAFSRSSRIIRASRSFSTKAPEPLFVWLGESSSSENTIPMLLPVERPTQPNVSCTRDIVDLVHNTYENLQILDMGDNDPGVSFCSVGNKDTLEYLDMITEAIDEIRHERHGVPFSIYTSGCIGVPDGLADLGATIHVCLYADNPNTYKKLTKSDDFNVVVGFLIICEESGITTEAEVSGFSERSASAARELALSLGAQKVHVFTNKKDKNARLD